MSTDRERIGVFAFGTSPIEHLPPLRLRALLGEAAFQGAECALFSTADCDTAGGTVLASLWSGAGWRTERIPLPAVVMIVTDPVRPEHHPVDAWLRSAARIIADHGPDKLEQIGLFEASPLAGHAIAAAPLTADTFDTLLPEWLSQYGGAVVKPVDGMRGGNIHFITRTGDRWQLQKREETREGSLEEIVAAMRAATARRMGYRRYMIQRYVESSHAGRALTLRIDVHKTPRGDWQMHRAAARLNIAGGLATNSAGGGAQVMIEKLLAQRTVRPGEAIEAEAIAIACQAAALIDAQPSASIIELGVDLALDAEDHLWIVEANARPEANWAEQDRAMHIVAYALSLIG